MRKIGLVGGVGPASTVEYYRALVRMCLEDSRINGYPEIVIDSVDMNKHDKAISEKNYDALAGYLIESLDNLKAAGAKIAAITANTEHIVWDKISNALPLPTVNVIDAVIEEIRKKKYKRVLVLGTKWTIESGLFDKAMLAAGIAPVVPNSEDREIVGGLIYPNLENGVVISEDKRKMIRIIEEYIEHGNVDAVLLGCTELPLMINDRDIRTPLINSMRVHVRKIFSEAIS